MTASERPGKRRLASRWAAGVPSRRISAWAISVVFRLTTSASVTTGFQSWADEPARRHAGEDRDDREEQERERDRRRAEHEQASERAAHQRPGRRKPAARSAFCAVSLFSRFTQASAAARCGLAFTAAAA